MSIIVIILICVVIAGYLVWLRSRYQVAVSPKSEQQVITATPQASPSATPLGKEATESNKTKVSTGSSKVR